ncbi:sigma-70 family RNA polymerase sigma factor [Phytohabitans aurantiacus]|uniref:sigma-70 family RNA polymerase sigma factor n=1 Tax=Phytohabitans aurantiacus TaxID=3016789 RepID=UPI0024901B16|nr:sigma-70 family RNA polymerase sigma factor [Phytohabitans aurantiacus]
MRVISTNEASLVVAAQAGDDRALEALATANLPLVYTIVRRALGDSADVDDVVQETMLRALRELPALRSPERFRSWLVAIATRQLSTHLYRRDVSADRAAPLDEATELAGADFEGPALLRLELSGQRKQVTRASHWLDPDDRALLSLWWLEVAGMLTRAELAAAQGMGVLHAGVRLQRMRNQLDVCRSLVAALEARPGCDRLAAASADWDGVPSPLWRKRLARHTKNCPVCARAAEGMVPAERLLVGFALLPVPLALSAAVLANSTLAGTAGGSAVAGAGGAKAEGLLGQLAQAVGAHPVATTVAAGALAIGAAIVTAALPPLPSAPAVIAAPTSAPASPPPASTPTAAPTRSASASAPPAPAGADPVPAGPSSPAAALRYGPVSLESVDQAGLVVTTADGFGVLERVDASSTGPARTRATFEVVRGLADGDCFSFRAEDGRYLRHSSWRLRLSEDEGNALFRGDATFCVRQGSVAGSVSLRSQNYPGAFVHRRGTELWVDSGQDDAAFLAAASFRPRPALAG